MAIHHALSGELCRHSAAWQYDQDRPDRPVVSMQWLTYA